MPDRKWVINKAGNLNRLKLVNLDNINSSENEVKVQVHYCGLNFADIFACLGLYSATPDGAFTPGLEFSGIVVQASGDSKYEPGDRVMGMTRFGGYSESITIQEDYISRIPENWELKHGASFPVQALTAWYGLIELGNLKQGDLVLVHSAAGGVGIHALQIIKSIGATAIATIGSQRKRSFLENQFHIEPDRIIVRDPKNFAVQLDRVLQSEHKDGFDIVMDAVGDPFFKPAWNRLSPAGRLIYFGSAGFMPSGKRPHLKQFLHYFTRTKIDPLEMISQNRNLMAFNLIWLYHRFDYLKKMLNDMNKISWKKPFIDKVFPFEEAREAIDYFKSGASKGKVLLSTAHASH